MTAAEPGNAEPEDQCDLGPNPEECAGEPVEDPWDLPEGED